MDLGQYIKEMPAKVLGYFKKPNQPKTLYERLNEVDSNLPDNECAQLEQKILNEYAGKNSCIEQIMHGETTPGGLLDKLNDKEFKKNHPDKYEKIKTEIKEIFPKEMIEIYNSWPLCTKEAAKKFGIAAGVGCAGMIFGAYLGSYIGAIGLAIGVAPGMIMGIYTAFSEGNKYTLTHWKVMCFDLGRLCLNLARDVTEKTTVELDENLDALRESNREFKEIADNKSMDTTVNQALDQLKQFKKNAEALEKPVNSRKKPSPLEEFMRQIYGKKKVNPKNISWQTIREVMLMKSNKYYTSSDISRQTIREVMLMKSNKYYTSNDISRQTIREVMLMESNKYYTSS